MSSEANDKPEAYCGNQNIKRKYKKVDKKKENSDLIKLHAFHDNGSTETDSTNSDPQQTLSSIEPSSRTNSSISSSRNMLIQYGKELVCLLALALTTYATLQNGPPKIARAPIPVSLFSKGSLVNEWPTGQLNIVQSKVSSSELSLVLFYAPWCAESQFAKHAYETVAKNYYKNVYFAAVNCWQPSGECRVQYAKVQSWPVLMAYLPQGVAVQYHGPWLAQSLTKFIKGLLQPYKRITSEKELLQLQINSNAVVVAFFKSMQYENRKTFQSFVQTAIKWLERDPYQDTQFAIVTGNHCQDLGVNVTPTLRIYMWNETKEIQINNSWTTDNITKSVHNNLHFLTKWIYPPGRKATTISPYLKAGPVLLFFTPKDYYSMNQDAYHMLKQVAVEFYRCKNGNSTNLKYDFASIYSHRKDNIEKYLKLKASCMSLSKSKQDNSKNYYKKCYEDDPNITFANILNNSKNYKFNGGLDAHCYVSSKIEDSSCSGKQRDRQAFANIHFTENFKQTTSMLDQINDKKSTENIRQMSINNECQDMLIANQTFGNIFFKNQQQIRDAELIKNACDFNRTFSFLLIDSILYHGLAERLGVDVLNKHKKSAIVILDQENDSTYQMSDNISTQSIVSFVQNFLTGALRRKLRQNKVHVEEISSKNTSPLAKTVYIKDINSNDFKDYINATSKNAVVLFHSVQCALCSTISQTLLTVAKILEPMNIDFFRIDADMNDLLWEYTMETYPTVVIFPRNRTSESRVYPRYLEINVSNVLGFVIANLKQEERLLAILESCRFIKMNESFQNCLRILRRGISDSIQYNLRKWRYQPKLRSETVRRLQVLQKMYLTSFHINSLDRLGFIRKEIVHLNKNKEQW